jgi:hypothetical protein
MRRFIFSRSSTLSLGLVLALASACGSNTEQPQGPPDSGGGDAPSATGGPWTQVMPMDGANTQATTVSGFWFESQTSGDVSFAEGLVEHFSAPTTIDAIALDGSGMLPGPADDAYFGFVPGTSLGLVVRNSTAKSLVASADHGKSFQYTAMYSTVSGAPPTVTPDFPLLWLGTDNQKTWHVAVTAGPGGDVYSSPNAPGATATLTDTWHPTGTITVPPTIAASDCTDFVANGVDPSQVLQVFGVTTDGSAMTYSSLEAICHSTDGGNTFVDVSANITPSSFTMPYPPEIYLFTSPTAGIGVFGNSLQGPGSAYVLSTADGGKSWTVGTLPASAQGSVSLLAVFASPSGSLFIAGGDAGLLLYKSSDGGKTWTDLSAKLSTFANGVSSAPLRLSAGFALDDQHIWVGGDSGFIAYTPTGGQ